MHKTFVLGPILGGLTHNRVKLWARASKQATMYAWISPESPEGATLVGSCPLKAASGFTGVIALNNLESDTLYHYALSLVQEPPPLASFRTFRTAPAPGQYHSFKFVFGSCYRPSKGGTAGRTFQRLQTNHPDLCFLLMIGDQIYADDWEYNGIGKIASDKSDYRDIYRYFWSNPHFRGYLSQTPVYMTLDDHEVDNDWFWREKDRQRAEIPLYTKVIRLLKGRPKEERQLSSQRVQEALQVYWEHQGVHAPDPIFPPQIENGVFRFDPQHSQSLAYTFEYGGAAFFVLDSRTMRIRGVNRREIIGREQMQALKAWLLKAKEEYPVKFIVTSSAFLHVLLGDFAQDRWSAFQDERDEILRFIANNNITQVFFLTGDLHSGHAISARVQTAAGDMVPVWEFCASPFEQSTNYLTQLFTMRRMWQKAWRDYRVHFVVNAYNYGIVHVDLDDPSRPRVRFDLHYLDKNGIWKINSVP